MRGTTKENHFLNTLWITVTKLDIQSNQSIALLSGKRRATSAVTMNHPHALPSDLKNSPVNPVFAAPHSKLPGN
jgi:hypothetical protein